MAHHGGSGTPGRAGRMRRRLMAAGAGHQLFWADAGGSVWGANPDGSDPRAIVTSGLAGAGLAVDASHIYWVNQIGVEAGNGSIWRANLDGTDQQALVTGQDSPVGVAVDATHLYWSNAAEGDSRINRANLDGTGPRTIVPGQDSAYGVVVGF